MESRYVVATVPSKRKDEGENKNVREKKGKKKETAKTCGGGRRSMGGKGLWTRLAYQRSVAVCFARAGGNEAPPIKGGVTIEPELELGKRLPT